MKYLLDVNALVALGFAEHVFHDRAVSWLQALDSPTLLTCSITELGFVRVLAQAPAYGFTLTQARTLLGKMKESETLRFHCRRSRCVISSVLGKGSEAAYWRPLAETRRRQCGCAGNFGWKDSGGAFDIGEIAGPEQRPRLAPQNLSISKWEIKTGANPGH